MSSRFHELHAGDGEEGVLDVGESVGSVAQDANWNVVALVNENGQVVERNVYLPFGEVTVLYADYEARYDTGYGWKHYHQGLRYEEIAGAYDTRFRWLGPSLGQFYSNDLLGFGAGDVNVRRYVGNNSLNRLDPIGLLSEPNPDLKYLDEILGSGGEKAATDLAKLLNRPDHQMGAISDAELRLLRDVIQGRFDLSDFNIQTRARIVASIDAYLKEFDAASKKLSDKFGEIDCPLRSHISPQRRQQFYDLGKAIAKLDDDDFDTREDASEYLADMLRYGIKKDPELAYLIGQRIVDELADGKSVERIRRLANVLKEVAPDNYITIMREAGLQVRPTVKTLKNPVFVVP
jgi:RHS repeat-associated protein